MRVCLYFSAANAVFALRLQPGLTDSDDEVAGLELGGPGETFADIDEDDYDLMQKKEVGIIKSNPKSTFHHAFSH